MHEKDPAPQALENPARPGGTHPAGPGATPGAAASGEVHPQPVTPPLTIAQLQGVLDLRLGFTVSLNTLERWCRHYKIRACRLGTTWRIPLDEMERIVQLAKLGETF